jgi:GTP-binding protein LepA
VDTAHIRNFSVIAHIDHGKSTLADRMLELCGAIEKREMRDQVLDAMDLERERGITIKAHSVTIYHRYRDALYELNLIDTPGHVDFNYEVQKSMQACEGAVLLVDTSQGVEAQTVANAFLAIEANLEILPVLNKVDLAHSRPEEVAEQIENSLAIDATDALHVSAKTGKGVSAVAADRSSAFRRPQVIKGPLRADRRGLRRYRGVIIVLRVFDGTLRRRDMVECPGSKVFRRSSSVTSCPR